jgi:uncharacterized protein YbjT (DUF2867 family)
LPASPAAPATRDGDPIRPRLVLVVGATGYIGGRLVPILEADGVRLRCLARRPEFLVHRVAESTEVIRGDLAEPESLRAALSGVDTAYFLAHAMGSAGTFEDDERRGALAFATAAREAKVRRIIYLGGLGGDDDLSPHLRSRHQVGRIFRDSGVPTLEFRAGIIIGSGSLSFEIIRALVERLPIMVTPRWVATLTQPIGVEDVLAFLVAGLDHDLAASEVVEIGGPDRISYGDIMREYARLRGLRRLMLPVPFLTPRLSSLWLRLVTPVYARVGRKLIDGLRNKTVVRDPRAERLFPIRPIGIRAALERALRNEDLDFAATRWSDAISAAGGGSVAGGRLGSRLVDSRLATVDAPAAQAFAPIQRIGGDTGWYFANLLWSLRGLIDLLLGGPGLRRGRRDPLNLTPGATIDCWRVEAFEPERLLRLSAEMKLPGRAWLQFEVTPHPRGATIRQTAIFDPRGLAGILYWYGAYPLHLLVFSGMLRGIARAATSCPPRPRSTDLPSPSGRA